MTSIFKISRTMK